ncbi:Kunitz/Bovine pancreatic trypsin inhibitor domain protein [Dictyocaulus viviparus]|uniref:Kunitz/Bovine pancreatic trypsin inhibitor domain protein n=1 Tax=Dictyocaulus viviparus TaxID=29172 RepID=A0A0D8XBG4_DICVI|nr:Kunitz/Bovine pancreatic trypsin inhibitor domain protein [Dictyocaulus viviparus]
MVSAGTPCYGRTLTVQRFYFNPKTGFDKIIYEVFGYVRTIQCFRTCQEFQYYGCNGNGNNFPSLQSCRDHCVNAVETGCDGTANRFTSRKACVSTCVNSSLYGMCPRGMVPIVENGETVVKECALNIMETCPPSASCVRSTTNQPICCQPILLCPKNRIPYKIPGSTSVVACNNDADECPAGNTCTESSSVPGFHMCCSSDRFSKSQFGGVKGPADFFSVSPCPAELTSNGQMCRVNAIGVCPRNYLCLRDVGFEYGSCCRTGPPKCALKQYVPVFVSGIQVQICQVDLGGCPQNSRCITSNIPRVSICCRPYRPSLISANDGNSIINGRPAQSKCRSGDPPLSNAVGLVKCAFIQNPCPIGYKCEFSSTGEAVCCNDFESIRCPVGSFAFEHGGRPLACPSGSTKCPVGFACIPSLNPQYHLCCSMSSFMAQAAPQCPYGTALIDPASNQHQFCSPLRDLCPKGYRCMQSDQPGRYICCVQNAIVEQFKGYCPPNQIPYVLREGFPATCHMQLNPCPTTAPYMCLYSAIRQNSYCCAPINAVASNIPNLSMAASIANGMPAGISSISSYHSSADISQSFSNERIAPAVGSVPIPEHIPGFNLEKTFSPIVSNLQHNINENHINNVDINRYGQPYQSKYTYSTGQIGQVDGNSNELDTICSSYGAKILAFSYGSALSSSTTRPVFTGCSVGSKALVRADHSIVSCEEIPCPNGFICMFSEKEISFQCCSLPLTTVNVGRNQAASKAVPSISDQMECPTGFFLFNGKLLFTGQKGCLFDEQCAAREPNATCDSGYCVCPTTKPLVHEGKCISTCPDGFANIAGRCYDPTTVIFMDSVDERTNGTIGGYCLETLIEEKRCVVENSYCSEKTITCQCKVGYSLDINFANKEDKYCFLIKYLLDFIHAGTCRQDESSKMKFFEFQEMSNIDDEPYFIDIKLNVSETTNTTLEDDDDIDKYLIQTDELVTSRI